MIAKIECDELHFYEMGLSKASLTKSRSIEIDFKIFCSKKQETPNAIK